MKPFAIYFPQFYRTEINDRVWGAGFTDWHLVSNANRTKIWPRRAPLKGYYDGSDEKSQIEILNEINSSELGGIALYHYWFFDSHELNSMEINIINNKLPATDWFLIWATESWSKRWVGSDETILGLDKNPSTYQIEKHCEHLLKCFESSNYLKINGKPLFSIYNISHFENPKNLIRRYRLFFQKKGVEILFSSFIKNPSDKLYSDLFDLNYLFEPRLFFGFNRKLKGTLSEKISRSIKKYLGSKLHNKLLLLIDQYSQKGNEFKAENFLKYFYSNEREEFIKEFKSTQNVISPGWNNAPRYGERFTCLKPLSPKDFKKLVDHSSNRNSTFPTLINAWNEWSEGAAIEPCYYEKSKYLESLKS